ncbi:MAG: hypothetical protein EP329_01985 [Deltaproteobacteria bacterium]|nr:MAG: hypothetical protein EP329_01985 [Deltaproteobacteria bacterium]
MKAWRHTGLAAVAMLAMVHCVEGGAPGAQGDLSIAVAALNLPGVTDADYTLTVHNGPGGTGEVVWTRAISSAAYGDGAGSLSYVGTCDAGTGINTVTLELTALYDASGALPVGSYMNPTPVSREVACVADGDVAVTFDIALARRAEQGFFDVAVQFQDLFCSAKLDCENPDGSDLELLHAPDGGRGMTAVLGFACTASTTGSTYLYMDDLVIHCAGFTEDVRVAPTGLGTQAPVANADGYLFGAAVYRGTEQLASKAYWNVSLGLDATTFAAAGACTLTTRATASREPFPQEVGGFPLPAGAVYPVVTWDVALSDASQRVCTSHEIDGGDGVATDYVGYLPQLNAFTWSPDTIYMQHRLQPIHPTLPNGEVLSAAPPVCDPACDHGGVCVADAGVSVCDCAGTGYDGAACEVPVCAAPCQNGGVCVAPDTCDCAGTGYAGAVCDVDVDECAAGTDACDPTATCTNTLGGYTCACPSEGIDTLGDGTVCDYYASCDALLAARGVGSGSYLVDPDGAGAIAPLTVYCDMTWDSGGWTLIRSTTTSSCVGTMGTVAPGTARYLPTATMKALANGASQVHIRTKDQAATRSATSSAGGLAIQNLRAGNITNLGQTMSTTSAPGWSGPVVPTNMWYNCAVSGTWPAVYWACNNSNGLHLTTATNVCSFTYTNAPAMEAMEVYLR